MKLDEENVRLDKKDLMILNILQKNCKISAKEISKKMRTPITTVFAKIKRMEKLGIIRKYTAILDGKMLGKPITAFILASFRYKLPGRKKLLSQRAVVKEIANFPEVQEVHIITGDWDILIKIKAEDIDSIGKFIIDKLRLVKGLEKTVTCIALSTEKETTELQIL
jgi:DNA-binding Lrp family transcriptional regulator